MYDVTVLVTYRNHLTSGELWRGPYDQIHLIPNSFARTLAEEALKKKKQCSSGHWTVRLLGDVPENKELWPLPDSKEAISSENSNSTDTLNQKVKESDPTDVFEAETKDATETSDEQKADDPTDVFESLTEAKDSQESPSESPPNTKE